MTDWLGMIPKPRAPRPELKARVLQRAFRSAGGRRSWRLAAVAVVVLAVGGVVWSAATVQRLRGKVAALEDTLALIRSPGTRVLHIPVTTGGRGGGGTVTIFADGARHRWLVACHGLAPNAPGEAYQIWFITEGGGLKSAAVMPMDHDQPMLMALDLPDGPRVMGAAMSIEPRSGSAEPKGRMVFHLQL